MRSSAPDCSSSANMIYSLFRGHLLQPPLFIVEWIGNLRAWDGDITLRLRLMSNDQLLLAALDWILLKIIDKGKESNSFHRNQGIHPIQRAKISKFDDSSKCQQIAWNCNIRKKNGEQERTQNYSWAGMICSTRVYVYTFQGNVSVRTGQLQRPFHIISFWNANMKKTWKCVEDKTSEMSVSHRVRTWNYTNGYNTYEQENVNRQQNLPVTELITTYNM